MQDKKLIMHTKKILLHEFQIQNRKGMYAKIQKMMAYNSNKIEGSTLTSEQTASLFDTGSLYSDAEVVYKAKDIEEMTGHFSMFNYMLKTIDEELSESIIKQFHFHLKAGVFEDKANGYLIGEYKNRANQVSDIETTLPKDVPEKMKKLLHNYLSLKEVSLDDIMVFHADFESIHPFQDGNGRVGRMILFRECLKNNIIPVIIKDESKMKYYHALHELQVNKSKKELLEYAVEEQKMFCQEMEQYIYDLENDIV